MFGDVFDVIFAHPDVRRWRTIDTYPVVIVTGEIEWMLNRTDTGWLVTLLNPAGQQKPQQGITPTDFRQNRQVTIKSHVPITTAVDRLLPDERPVVKDNTLHCEVPAGGVRIIEVR